MVEMAGEEDGDMGALRQKKLQEQMSLLQAVERQKKELLEMLEPAAYERLSNVRISSPENYKSASNALLRLKMSGQVKRKIRDDELRALLLQLVSNRPEGSITFKRK